MSITVKGLKMGHMGYQNGYDVWIKTPNSAGGVSVSLSFCNKSSKTIKYANFKFIPYNSVGDIVSDTISGQPYKVGQCTGFVGENQWKNGIMWKNLFYNNSIVRVDIQEVNVQYEDGTEETFPRESIEFIEGGCYIATAVYGAYDCPQVWAFRRFRDYKLSQNATGRMFIRIYYALSPKFIKLFGKTKWFNILFKKILDRFYNKLLLLGYNDAPYIDE